VVEELQLNLKNPAILASLVVLVLVYSNIIKIRQQKPFTSLLQVQNLNYVCGTIASSPSKNTKGTFYSSQINLDFISGNITKEKEKSFFSASGTIQIQIPSSLVESFSPGKLFTASDKGFLVESGANVLFSGKWSQEKSSFIVNKIDSCEYKKNVFGKIDYIRALCRLVFKRLMFSWGSAGALILSLLSGSRDFLSESVRVNFKNAGLSHILALSGMHLSFFSGLTGSTGRKLFGAKHIYLIQLASILIFVWFAGLSPSLFRALLCSAVLLTSTKISYKKQNMLAIISWAFLIHIVVFPQDLLLAAFMLSYGALAGILTIGSLVKKTLSLILPTSISNSLSSSIGAQTMTTPVSILLFGEVMPIGIIASMIVSPLITFFLTISLLFIIVSLCIPFLSPAFGYILQAVYKIIMFFVNSFSQAAPVVIN